MSVFTEAFAHFPEAQRDALQRTADAAMRALPDAQPCVSWGMPTMRAAEDGPYLLSIMGFARHNSLFPHSGALPTALGDVLDGYLTTKGTIHFDRDRPFPIGLLKQVLAARIDEVNASYPRRNGEFRAYSRTGARKDPGRKAPRGR